MKKISTLLMICSCVLAINAQSVGELITSSSDLVGHSSSVEPPMIVQARADQFYWIGACSAGDNLEHPSITNVSDFDNLIIARYDKYGKMDYNKLVLGSRQMRGACSFQGDLTILGGYSGELMADDLLLPESSATTEEFLLTYTEDGLAHKLVPVWENKGEAYMNSRLAMDPRTGDFFVYGITYSSYIVAGHGPIGDELDNYFYVIRYDHDLNLRGVKTFGFDDSFGEYANYRQITLCPGVEGNPVIAGLWEGDRPPVMDGDTLKTVDMSHIGVFALKLDEGLNRMWALEGSLNGEDWDYSSAIDEGLALQDGSIVFTGRTVTGFFNLEGVQPLTWDKGPGFSNMFAFHLDPDGRSRWAIPINNMAEAYMGKGSKSDHLRSYFEQDALNWRDKTLYMTGKFGGDEFVFAGETLSRELYEGAFVLAIGMEKGDELWAYGMSSDNFELSGFDLDRSGNVCLLGQSSADQVFQAVEVDSVPGSRPLFLLGLDHDGNPLWKNNAFIGDKTWGYSASDLEVLDDGTLFAAMYKTQPEPFEIGGTVLNSQMTNTLILVSLRAENAVGGMVVDKDGVAAKGARIKAIKSTRLGTRPVMDSLIINDAGQYSFTGLYPGNYIFQVIPDLSENSDGMTTYSGGAISWDQARVIPVQTQTNSDFLDIILSELAKLTPADGSGKAIGNVSYADEPNEVIGKGTMGKPAKKTSVLLLKKSATKGTMEDDVVAYVETDDVGNYVFENVPDGEYILIVDIPGLPMVETYDVVIEGNMIVSGLDFTVGSEGINTSGGTGIESRDLPSVGIYPNPGNGLLYISISLAGDYLVEVYDSRGSLHATRNLEGMNGLAEMDVTGLQSGLYLIKIQGDAGSTTLKYLKQ